jgi:LysM repeat protein
VAEQADICMMCHQPVDSLPLSKSIFSGSWLGIALGLVIVVGVVIWVTRTQGSFDSVAQAVEPGLLPATLELTPYPSVTRLPTNTPTGTPLPTPTPLTHVVEAGDTLEFIAQLYGVSVDKLIDLNEVKDVRALSVGQSLTIPARQGPEWEPNPLPSLMIYVVNEGDTLSSISFEIGTPMEAIEAANPNLKLDLIYPGQEIVVPLTTPTPTATLTPLPTATWTPTPRHLLPSLLTPFDGQDIDASTVLLNWTSTGHLADDEYYVVHLEWPDGQTTEHWAKNTSWRLTESARPSSGTTIWSVTIMRQTGTASDGQPVGQRLSGPGTVQSFEWR